MRVQHALSARSGRVVLIAETTILFSTQAEVVRYRKCLAAQAADSALGVNVTTPNALVEELWEVWGTGERLVSDTQRRLIIKQLLAEQSDWVDSPGTAELLVRFLCEYLCEVDEAFLCAYESDLTPSDRDIVCFIKKYQEALVQVQLIEPVQALKQLASCVQLGNIIVRTQDKLPTYYRSFLAAVAKEVRIEQAQIEAPSRGGDGASSTTGEEVSSKEYVLLKPAGSSVRAFMVDQAIRAGGVGTRIVVTSPNPVVACDLLKHSLCAQGYTVMLDAQKTFRETLFGQAYCALAGIANDQAQLSYNELVEAALLYLNSPYAQIPPSQAERLASAFRSDRSITREDVHAALASSKNFGVFESLFEDTEGGIVLSYFEGLIHSLDLDEAQKVAERAAIARLKQLYFDAADLGVDAYELVPLAERISVPYGYSIAQAEEGSALVKAEKIPSFLEDDRAGMPCILFTTFEQASALPKHSCDQVVLTELNNESYSGKIHRSTLSDFLERYSLPFEDHTIETLEARFKRVCALACMQVVFEYERYDRDGESCYPAFFLETFMNERALAGCPVEVREAGEEAFDSASRLSLQPVELEAEMPAERGVLNAEDRMHLLTYEQDKEGIERLVVSPSAIETYRSCPYKWFVERKLRLDDEGEAFGGREIGTFVHGVFQRFYEAWALQGYDRVTPETLSLAQELLASVFEEYADEQKSMQLGDRLIAVSELERQELEQLKSKLLANLSFQQNLFKDFHVRSHEYAIRAEDKVTYGGAIINGRIDRVDVDDKGSFIVIDYKGSIAKYAAGFDPDALDEEEFFESPEKIQALIYAQALRRKEGLQPKAALYLSYSAKNEQALMRGSLAQTLIESETLSRASCVKGNFASYLDLVEEDIARTIERMESGDVAPDPRTKDACTYCPVLYCEKRANGS